MKNLITDNFIKKIIDSDLAQGLAKDLLKFRFPPEPNGYLHIGHAKAICLNFLLAQEYGASCLLRFDDTNPLAEKEDFYRVIEDDIRWLGFEPSSITYASDYFDRLFNYANELISNNLAYVDSESPEEIKSKRGNFNTGGTHSIHRKRSVDENLQLFEDMKKGVYQEGEMVLRAKIDMASANINMRDPVLYRIINKPHQRTKDRWSIYPLYDFAHPLCDAIEHISHSLCTLEFEDHRPLYEWFNDTLIKDQHLPKQIEFARLKITNAVISKRNILADINNGKVLGWTDPRLATLGGLKKRGHLPGAIVDFCIRTGYSKANSEVEFSYFENISREHLNKIAPRYFAVIDPVKLIITNLPQDKKIPIETKTGRRLLLTNHLWVNKDDVRAEPDNMFYRLAPGNQVKLKFGYIITCTRVDTLGDGYQVYAEIDLDSKDTIKNKEGKKVKGIIHWLPIDETMPDEFYYYSQQQTGEPEMKTGYVEDIDKGVKEKQTVQFERIGYFKFSPLKNNNPVWVKTVELRESKTK